MSLELTDNNDRNWVSGIPKVILGIPNLLIGKERRAYSIQRRVFENYCLDDNSDAAEVVRTRYNILRSHGVSYADIVAMFARIDLLYKPTKRRQHFGLSMMYCLD